MDLTPQCVLDAAAWTVEVAARVPADRWTTTADGGDPAAWSARRNLDHCVDTLLLYSAYVSRRATGRLAPPRNGDADAGRKQLASALLSSASILVDVLTGLRPHERAFHPSGRADRSGWVGMACTELLVHSYDVARAGGIPPERGPVELAAATVGRVLPWTPDEGDGWQQLLWATGRAALGDRPPQAVDWWWQSAPLAEWDGRPRRRDAPPQW